MTGKPARKGRKARDGLERLEGLDRVDLHPEEETPSPQAGRQAAPGAAGGLRLDRGLLADPVGGSDRRRQKARRVDHRIAPGARSAADPPVRGIRARRFAFLEGADPGRGGPHSDCGPPETMRWFTFLTSGRRRREIPRHGKEETPEEREEDPQPANAVVRGRAGGTRDRLRQSGRTAPDRPGQQVAGTGRDADDRDGGAAGREGNHLSIGTARHWPCRGRSTARSSHPRNPRTSSETFRRSPHCSTYRDPRSAA